ncbi:carboxypeptidase regulatory-like domain-containing protein [Myxococcus sp. K15C18031901]|uniref:carboxypeptidase regulatory-like domain-containing protein n=1 Tax=Myxococcus dinghuensis TaxID=2906761 RepID=UPI0020A7DC06|nr:carboxypeptidase regulatory-like domain-containing protein [Myxococcus dinghuensis]MCP3102782.1 carboxypeptidase regulatory-like domain-containing protein [Myxococcus dinghuensis]
MSKHRRRQAAAILFLMVVLTFSVTHDASRPPPRGAPFSTRSPPREATADLQGPPAHVPEALQDASVPRPSMWLRGRVLSTRTGLGIPSATLVILRQGRAETLQSNPHGEFEFEPPLPGDYVIAGASHPDFQPFAPAHGNAGMRLRFEPGTHFTDVTLMLAPLVFCEGTVRDEQGRPSPRAKVHFLSTGRWDPASAPPQKTFEADAAGRFRIPLIPDALIQAESGQARSQVECLCILTDCPLQLDLREGTPPANLTYIEGKVLDTQGHPASDIRVSATSTSFRRAPADGEAPINDGGLDEELLSTAMYIGPLEEAVTDEGGHFVLGPLARERYDVFIATLPEAAVTVPTGTRDVLLTLPDTGRIRGQVSSEEDGAPIPCFSVDLEKYRANGEPAWSRLGDSFRRGGTLHDAAGAFEFQQLVPGRYRVHVAALGFSAAAQTVAVPASETVWLSFSLKKASRLRGVVTDARTGRPLRGAVVTSWRPSLQGDWSEAVATSDPRTLPVLAHTAEDGSFELLPAREEPLWVSHEGFNPWVIRESTETGRVLRVSLSPLEGHAPVGEYAGVGLAYEQGREHEGMWVVMRVLKGGPADHEGIREGDLLLAIDDAPAVGMQLAQVISRIRGELGTRVRLRFSRGPTGREFEVVLTRARLPE